MFRKSRRAEVSPVIWLIITAALALVVAFIIAYGGGGKIVSLFKSTSTCNNDMVGYCACLFKGETCPSALARDPQVNAPCCPPNYFNCTKANVNNLIDEAKKDVDHKYSQHSGQDWSFPKDEAQQKTWYGTLCRGSLLGSEKVSVTKWKEYPGTQATTTAGTGTSTTPEEQTGTTKSVSSFPMQTGRTS